MFKMLGPAVAGVLIGVFGEPGPAFLVDGVTFAVSIWCLLVMEARSETARENGDTGTIVAEIREGFRYVRTQVWLWGTFLAATLAYLIFLGPAEVLLPFVVEGGDGRFGVRVRARLRDGRDRRDARPRS